MNAVALAGVIVALSLHVVDEDPWTSGPDAPAPQAPLPYPQAPREPGAHVQVLDVPQQPPDPRGALVDSAEGDALGGADEIDHRFMTTRTRAELFARGALDLDTALVDVPGLWLRHEQAGNARALLRGLDERDLDVTLDGVPLFDLGGLISPLEQLSNASTARLTVHHGPRAWTASPKGSAGAVDVDTLALASMRDQGESFALHGVLGGGYGGPDLEKGVFTDVETGWGRARFSVHATLLNREDQREGRTPLAPGDASRGDHSGILERSGGDGGAVGARVDVVPTRSLRVFTTWHSSRALDVPHPALCQGDASSAPGVALDCTRTTERGLDLWIAGADQSVDVAGVDVVVHGRAHVQHGVANEERTGVGLAVVERSFDDGVRGGGRAWVDVALPAVALGDVWTPRASLGVDGYADRFSSTFFSRSLRRADAEPPGNGIADPTHARLRDGATTSFTSLSARVEADGARAALWSAGRVSNVDLTGELGARARVVEDLDAYAVVVHRGVGGDAAKNVVAFDTASLTGVSAVGPTSDDTVEGGVVYSVPWLDVGGDVFGSARTDSVAYGMEARAALRPGVPGLVASSTLSIVAVDDGAVLAAHKPQAGVPNPMGTVELAWDPPRSSPVVLGFLTRARFFFPQQRLSSTELLDRALCPELPSDDQLAVGVTQSQPCSGATGAFLFDLGAHVDVGAFRIDAIAENLLDQEARFRDEPIGFGGASFRALLTLAL